MNAREFLLTDPKIQEAVSNGYDIRLEEHEWIEKMELYAFTKQNSHKHSVMQGLASRMQDCPPEIAEIVNKNWDKLLDASPSVGDGAAGQNVSDGHIHYHVHAGSMQKCIICNEITDLDCG